MATGREKTAGAARVAGVMGAATVTAAVAVRVAGVAVAATVAVVTMIEYPLHAILDRNLP